ncbi:MAG TPA: cytochrome c biogenesis protein CcdA [Acidimicrobiales bacterium]|jgi:cytochrome c-type biogenesis protein
MIAGIHADPLGILVAFGAGILSFLSPCVLPLVPGYLSLVSGLSAAELTALGGSSNATVAVAAPPSAAGVVTATAAATATATATAPATTTAAVTTSVAMRPVLRGIGLFVLGFTVIFVALGAVASGIGHLLHSHEILLARVSGVVIVVLGVILIIGALPGDVWSKIGSGPRLLASRLLGERRFDVRPSTLGMWAAPVMGMAFAFAWTPCLGPVLGSVLSLAASNGTLAGGVLLLFAYSLGLAIPFVAAGLAFGRLTAVFARARRRLWIIELAAGVILLGFGVLLITHDISVVSSDISRFLNDIGLGRLSTS